MSELLPALGRWKREGKLWRALRATTTPALESYRYSRRHSVDFRPRQAGMCVPLRLPFHFRSGFARAACTRAQSRHSAFSYLANSRGNGDAARNSGRNLGYKGLYVLGENRAGKSSANSPAVCEARRNWNSRVGVSSRAKMWARIRGEMRY